MQNKTDVRTILYTRHVNSSHYGILLAKSDLKREFPVHQHDFYEFEFVRDGLVKHTLYGNSRILERGDFYCLSPGVVHRIERVSAEVSLCNISVYLPDASPVVKEAVERFWFPCEGKLDDETVTRLIHLYDILFDDARCHAGMEKEKVSALVAYVLTELATKATERRFLTKEDRSDIYLAEAMRLIRNTYTNDLSLVAVAKELGISAGYLSSLFSKRLGVSFKEYLTNTRISHALHLLSTTDASVTEIAFACGFGSFCNFERVFLKLNGQSPLSYRRSLHPPKK